MIRVSWSARLVTRSDDGYVFSAISFCVETTDWVLVELGNFLAKSSIRNLFAAFVRDLPTDPRFEIIAADRDQFGLVEFLAPELVSGVPALLHYSNFSEFSVVQKRGNHPDKQGGGLNRQSQFESGCALCDARPDKEWSLTDCISMVVLEQRSIRDVFTFTADHHFEQAGYKTLLK